MSGSALLFTVKKGYPYGYPFFTIRAIDGARTRGLDLGKVARYQLRHYRIFIPFGRNRLYITSRTRKCQQLFLFFLIIFFFKIHTYPPAKSISYRKGNEVNFMSSKTKIVVVKLKDILFYATVVALCIIVLLLLYILFQPAAVTTGAIINV